MAMPDPALSRTDRCTAKEALAHVRLRGVVLVSAKGAEPSLVEILLGRPFKGSWWALPEGTAIFNTLNEVAASDDVLVCRLVNAKVTLVHRRLWPAMIRLAHRVRPEQIAQVRQEHTPSGRHVNIVIPFPEWVPAATMAEAGALSEQEALAAFGVWLPPPAPAPK